MYIIKLFNKQLLIGVIIGWV